MSKISKDSGFTPTFHARYEFMFDRRIHGVVEVQLMPNTPALTMIATKCDCKDPECAGWTPVDAHPAQALPIMGKVINELLDEREAAAKQQLPGAN